MLTTMILTVAMMGQTAADRNAEGQFGQPAAQAQADPLEAAIARARARGKLKPAGYDRKAQLRKQVAAQERAEALAQRLNAIEAQRQYERMLPYALENQRQMLNRQSQLERNQILNRMVTDQESQNQQFQWWLMQQRAR